MFLEEVSTPQPVFVSDVGVMLDVCSWKVPAGFPSPAADHAQERIDLNKQLIRNKEATYIFRVKGDSMTGIGIYEGDTLLVDRSVSPKHNHVVLAQLNNEFTVKRLYRRFCAQAFSSCPCAKGFSLPKLTGSACLSDTP